MNPTIDRKGITTSTNKKKLALITWLEKVDFTETYRFCNLQGGKFTWKNTRTQTRIDQVWISKELKLGLKESDIEDMEFCTDSDHNLIWAQIRLDPVLSFGKEYTTHHQNIERKIFLYKDTMKENWEDFTKELEKLLNSTSPVKGKILHSSLEKEQETEVEKINTL